MHDQYALRLNNFRRRLEWNFGQNFKLILVIVDQGIYCETTLRLISSDLTDGKFNIGSGDGLALSDNMPLPVSLLTQTYVAIWRY